MHGFNKNVPGQAMAETKPAVTDFADHGIAVEQNTDDFAFQKTEFA
jgi:hypothetical protein